MIKLTSAPTLTHAETKAQNGDALFLSVLTPLSFITSACRWGGAAERPWRHRTECSGVCAWWESTRLFGRFAVMIVSTITSEAWPERRKKTRCSARTDCGGVTTPGLPATIASRALAVCTNDWWSTG